MDKNTDPSVIVLDAKAFEELYQLAGINCYDPCKLKSLHKHARKRNTWLRDKHVQQVERAKSELAAKHARCRQLVGELGGKSIFLSSGEISLIEVKVLRRYPPDKSLMLVKDVLTRREFPVPVTVKFFREKPANRWTIPELEELGVKAR